MQDVPPPCPRIQGRSDSMAYGLSAVLIVVAVGFFIWRLRPVPGLTYISLSDVQPLTITDNRLKLVDIRDAVDFYEGHVQDAVNIYVGRMPYVWSRHMEQGDNVVLIGDRPMPIRRAARILRRRAGIRVRYAIIYTGRDEASSWERGHAC